MVIMMTTVKLSLRLLLEEVAVVAVVVEVVLVVVMIKLNFVSTEDIISSVRCW